MKTLLMLATLLGAAPAVAASTATETINAFHGALAAGDLAGARALLDPDVKIFEGGGVEHSADEYAAHHLPADAAFMKDAQVETLASAQGGDGKFAWVATESRITAAGKNGPVELMSTETIVLKHGEAGWRIVHIHWSSRPAE